MHDDDEDLDSLYISFTIETKIVRVIGNTLLPSKITVKADINPDDDMEQEELTLAMSKIRFWFDSIVTKTIAFAYDNDSAMGMLIDENGKNRSGNILMITPGEPSDDVLAQLFQSKVTALSGGRITFAMMEVRSDNPMGLSFVFIGDGRAILPTMENWIGKRSFFKDPWWSRDDASTLDVIPPPDADLTKKPAWAFSLDTVVNGARADAGLVVRPSFKPTIIDGGK